MPPEAADGADAASVPASDAAAGHESAADGARIVGAIDLVKGHRVAGWALDRAHPDVPLEVEIRRAGAPIARARADRHRRDLEKAGIGTGRHGFEVTLEASDELPGPDSLEAVALDQAGRAVPLVNRAAASARSPDGQAPIATEVRILADEVRGLGVALRAALA
ncbi:MAG TPA: hypothetical protein VLA44_01970, partial [Clostridia bacterium]|nr:hypothetical protein [Clostridia bacterium]